MPLGTLYEQIRILSNNKLNILGERLIKTWKSLHFAIKIIKMDQKKRKVKKYYTDQMRKHMRKGGSLEVGMKGYLCSCQYREKDCVKEAYNVLNKYYDLLHGKKDQEEATEKEVVNDISDDLQNEIKQLQSEGGAKSRFKSIESGAKNLLFIKTKIDNHAELIDKLIFDLINEKQPQTRFLLKMIPIHVVCKARVDDIKLHMQPLLENSLKEKPNTFGIAFNSRNNDSLSKDDVIRVVAEMVQNMDKNIKVYLAQPELSVIIEVIKGFALLAVIKNFVKNKRYHLIHLCNDDTIIKEEPKNDVAESSKEKEDSINNIKEKEESIKDMEKSINEKTMKEEDTIKEKEELINDKE